ncbi:sulfotransferase domain-containing protein [Salisaeta longa]|uniref:sulfotransferase domain-containing protein n=1 Tax=Salisaeta longa TaxID=503170 RepID=UPI00146ECB15|nr:sulfotransferase domain-containing protein [Salisaeta longa]
MQIRNALPTFLICGAQKAGTTALYAALQQHPDICMSRPKETEFFNWRFDRGWKWFESNFAHHNGESAVGEASTRTMPTPEAPERICERLPDVKLVFVLRNPVDRAYSAFWFYLSTGILPAGTDFGTFIRNEGHPLRHEIIQYGEYHKHLKRFKMYFDEDQLLILRYRDLREDARMLVERVDRFIGVDPNEHPELPVKRQNVTQHPSSPTAFSWAKGVWKGVEHRIESVAPKVAYTLRSKGKQIFLRGSRPKLTNADKQYLQKIYQPTIRRTELEAELDFSHWN